MIKLVTNNITLDLKEDAVLRRERNSPFFLTVTGDGKDGIPGEVSYPFDLPLTDGNVTALGHPNILPVERTKEQDATLSDDTLLVSQAKLVMGTTSTNLNTNRGYQNCFLLHNSSAFFRLIAGKKLTELALGGDRVFEWNGYDKTVDGFWKHVHDTWDNVNDDDGDYVFYSIKNTEYLGYATNINKVYVTDESPCTVEISPDNVTSLCPHIYLSYVIKQVFTEHGYTVTGDILQDADFKKITLVSLMGVYWSNIITNSTGDGLVTSPLSMVTIRLGQHLPPKTTIAEFLVECCKFLPIGFEVDDNAKTCVIKNLSQPDFTAAKDIAAFVDPNLTLPFNKNGTPKVYGINRSFTNDTYAQVNYDRNKNNVLNEVDNLVLVTFPVFPNGGDFLVNIENEIYNVTVAAGFSGYGLVPVHVASNVLGYDPPGATDYIESNMTPLAMEKDLTYFTDAPTVHGIYILPAMECEGNWFGKSEISDWGLRIMFYRGREFPVLSSGGGTFMAPWATHHCNRFVYGVPPGGAGIQMYAQILGNWSLAYENQQYGLITVWWAYWLRVLEMDSWIKGTMSLDILEYLNLRWSDVIQLQNVNFMLKQISDQFPFISEGADKGKIDFEAIRLPV